MDDTIPQVRVGTSTLTAVPAVHFRIPAAETVYRQCRQPSPPDAVAVELAPTALAAVVAWLRALGVGPGPRHRLPCMLGLVQRGLTKNPSDEAASSEVRTVRYDERMGRLLCLSPTDSIIEAVRSALELELPVYGVDLDVEEEALPPVVLQDPAHALGGKLGTYVRTNVAFAARGRGAEAATRRERTMAGRLKTLLGRYDRVLFTGGLGHWKIIESLLQSNAAARPLGRMSGDPYERALVHPLLALRHMDALPRLTALYEDHRQAGFADSESETAERYGRCLQTLLAQVYQAYFQTDDAPHPLDRTGGDLRRLPAFQQFLLQRCAVGLKLAPDLGLVMRAAQGNLSRRFTAALADGLMDFDWATPNAFPDLPLVMEGNEQRQGSHADFPWQWRDQPPSFRLSTFGPTITWPAVDFLLSALAYRALALTAPAPENTEAEPFEGRLYDGVDLRATARARRRGDRGVYVRRRVPPLRPARTCGATYEPTVYLFRTGKTPPAADWGLYECDMPAYFRQHVRDPHRMDEAVRSRGRHTVTAIGYGYWGPVPEAYRNVGISLKVLHGFIIFRPAHLSLDAEARWLEAADYAGQPMYHGGGMGELAALYEETYGITLGAADWEADLVSLALPYARRRVVVIAPDDFAVPPAVYETARRLRKEVSFVPHSVLPNNELRDASLQYHVPLCDDVGEVFPDEIIALLGEPFRYRAMMPPGTP